MAQLNVLHFPDPRLRATSAPVETVDASIGRLLDDMLETLYEAPGIGLAAIQVNVPKRVVVIDVSEQKNEPVRLINPKVVDRRGTVQTEEGCLSVPGVYEIVERAEWIRAEALDREGRPFTLEAEGLLAVCVQHEIDHLDGKLFVDYLSQLKRQRIRKKAIKAQRECA